MVIATHHIVKSAWQKKEEYKRGCAIKRPAVNMWASASTFLQWMVIKDAFSYSTLVFGIWQE